MCKKLSLLFFSLLLLAVPAVGAPVAIFVPSDPIIAIDADGNSADQPGELVEEAIDGILGGANMKYLNPGGPNSGFIITPSFGPSTVTKFGIWTANDVPARDPATWAIYGTNDPITSAEHSTGTSENWTLIGQGSIALPAQRNSQTPTIVNVANNTPYTSYKMLFPTNQGDGLLQFAEIQFYEDKNAGSPNPADGAKYTQGTYVSLGWTVGPTAAKQNLYFGTSYDDVLNGTGGTLLGNNLPITTKWFLLGYQGFPYPQGLEWGETYYWRIESIEANGVTKQEGEVWSFWLPPWTAYNPVPADGMGLVDLDADLAWTAGTNAGLHYVNISTDYDTVANAALGSGTPIGQTSVDPTTVLGPLQPNTTYYWRVDEHIPPVTYHEGDVWSFTTASGKPGGLLGEYYSFPQAGQPANPFMTFHLSRIDPTIDFGWGDLSPDAAVPVDGFSARWVGEITIPMDDDYTIYGGSDDGIRVWINNTLVVDAWVDRGEAETSGEITLAAGVYPIEVHYYENGGGAAARLRWSSPHIAKAIVPEKALSPPVKASGPRPGNGSVDVNRLADLQWSAGQYAVSHDVYLGTDATAVANATKTSPEFKGNQPRANTKYDPGTLALAQTYYWRVDEVNTANPDSPWTGNLWSFTVGDFLVIDDMEDYNNFTPYRIFETWSDGWGTTNNGSIVGYPEPDFDAGETFVETGIVNSGDQSMPYFYNNNMKHSEATQVLPAGLRDWTQEGVKALSLWYYGYPASQGSFVEGPAGIYTMTAAGADIWGQADQFHYAWKQLQGAGSMTVKVGPISGANLNAWAKAGIMIRQSLDPNSPHAFMAATSTEGVAFQYRPDVAADSANHHQRADEDTRPIWIKLDRAFDGTFTASHANDVGGNPDKWTALNTTSIQMNSTVYIGLALTSHTAYVPATVTFSNITTTGTILGTTFTAQDIGIQSNGPEQMYVKIKDAQGRTATVYNTDLDAANVTTWTEWGQYGQGIALQEFVEKTPALNLSNIDAISLGFGTPGNTQPGGSGLVFFDDIRLYKPVCVPQLAKPDQDFNNDCLVSMPDLEILTNNWLVSDYEVTPVDPGTAGLLGYYRFENNLQDSSGNGNNGTATGTPTYAAGQVGNALDLAGSPDDVVDIGLQPSELGIGGNAPKTVTAWVYVRSFNGGGIFDMGANVNSQNFSLRTLGTPNLWRAQRYGYPTYDFDFTYPSDNVWVHMALVYEGEAGGHVSYAYADGKRVAMQIAELNTTDTGRTFQIGRWSGSYFDGLIDEVRLYNRGLSQGEVAYLAGQTAPFTQPIGLLVSPADDNMDANADGTINFADYAVLIDAWLDEILWP